MLCSCRKTRIFSAKGFCCCRGNNIKKSKIYFRSLNLSACVKSVHKLTSRVISIPNRHSSLVIVQTDCDLAKRSELTCEAHESRVGRMGLLLPHDLTYFSLPSPPSPSGLLFVTASSLQGGAYVDGGRRARGGAAVHAHAYEAAAAKQQLGGLAPGRCLCSRGHSGARGGAAAYAHPQGHCAVRSRSSACSSGSPAHPSRLRGCGGGSRPRGCGAEQQQPARPVRYVDAGDDDDELYGPECTIPLRKLVSPVVMPPGREAGTLEIEKSRGGVLRSVALGVAAPPGSTRSRRILTPDTHLKASAHPATCALAVVTSSTALARPSVTTSVKSTCTAPSEMSVARVGR